MRGIYYKDGVYVLIENVYKPDYSIIEHDDCVLNNNKKKRKQSLYGGRVYLHWFNIHFEDVILYVDGISISNLSEKLYDQNHLTLPLSSVAQHLNAIEVHGVDAFMQNYKQNVAFLYDELKEIRERTELELSTPQDETKRSETLKKLEKIKDILQQTLSVLFTLQIFISAGLENEKVISVYQSIMDTIA